MKMPPTIRYRVLAVPLVIMILAGCSTVQLQQSWRNPNIKPAPLTNLLVLGAAEQPSTRRLFEDVFVAELRKQGLKAQPTYPLLSLSQQINRPKTEEIIRQTGADGIIMAKLVGVQDFTRTMYPVSTPANIWTDPAVYPVGETFSRYSLEVRLYESGAGTPVWLGTFTTFDPDRMLAVSGDLAVVTIQQLKRDGFLAPAPAGGGTP
jgi:hypothetical protein